MRQIPEIAVRRAHSGDRHSLEALVRRFYVVDGHPYDAVTVERALGPLLEGDAHGQVWVLDDGGVLIGYAVVTWSWSLESGGRDCMLDEIYVDRRSGGLGARLLEAVMGAAREAGAASMFLETEAANDGARRFYARHGFAAEDSIWMGRALDP